MNISTAFNICCPRDCVSRHNGGTSGAPLKPLRVDSPLRALSTLRGLRGAPEVAPIMPRDAVSRTANVERTGRHKWVKSRGRGKCSLRTILVDTILKFIFFYRIFQSQCLPER